MRRYHHIGIPTSESRPGERHIKHLKTFIVGHENSEYGVEWMRFEADATIPELVSPSEGVRVAFIVENGAPIEFLEFTDPNHTARR